MGGCISSGGIIVSEQEKAAHREAEKALKEQKAKLDQQVKVCTISTRLLAFSPEVNPFVRTVQVLLLGSGDSGKSTILKVSNLGAPYSPSVKDTPFEHSADSFAF